MQQNVNNQDEIDLLKLLAKFYSTLRKNIVLTIALPLLGMLAAFVLNKTSPRRITSEMMIVTDLLSESEGNFLMEQFEKADSIPGVSRDIKSHIGGVSHEIYEIKGIPTADSKYSIKINAVVDRYSALSDLQRAIVNYLNSSEPVARTRKQQGIYYTRLIKKIDEELDSLQQVKRQMGNATKATLLNPSDLFVKAVDLYDKKVQYELKLNDNAEVLVVQGFTDLPKNAKLARTYSMMVGFLGGCVVLLVILFLRFFSAYYKQYQSSSD